jgi:FkbM family methyltransferase
MRTVKIAQFTVSSGMSALINLNRFFRTHPLTRGAPLKAWARFASWQIRSRLQKELIVPWIEGQRLVVQRGMTGATGNIYVGLHEFADMMLPLHFLREGDLFLDIGANVGSYTVIGSGVCRATTWAFEPDPDTVRYLRRNVAINGLENLVTIYERALGRDAGEIPFTIGLDTINRVAGPDENNVRMVRQERLDALIGTAKPVMMKMDVEGYEEEVLGGAQDLLRKECLKVVELETVTPLINELLLDYRFERAYYDPANRRLEREPIGACSSNSVFVKDWTLVSARLTAARKIKVLGQAI